MPDQTSTTHFAEGPVASEAGNHGGKDKTA
jgi:hypothetical protein